MSHVTREIASDLFWFILIYGSFAAAIAAGSLLALWTVIRVVRHAWRG